MGVLSAAYTAAFLGPNGNGTTSDGAPYRPKLADAAALGAAVDNAIPNAQDLAAEATTRGQADTALGQEIAAEATSRGQADTALGQQLATEATTRGQADTALGQQLAAEATTRGQADMVLGQQLAAETTTRGQADTVLGQQVAAEAMTRGQADAALGQQLTAEATTRGQADTALGQQLAAETTALGQQLTAEATTRGQADTALGQEIANEATTRGQADTVLGQQLAAEVQARLADLAASRLLALLGIRPGDAPLCFTSDLGAAGSVLPVGYAVAQTLAGRVLRIAGAGTLAPVALRALEPGRIVKVRTVLSRYVDTRDPSGDAVGLFLAWFDGTRALMPATTEVAVAALTIARGPLQLGVLVSPDLGDTTVLRPPAGAAYFAPVVQTWGDTPVTDVAVLETADITDFGGVSIDLDSVINRLAAVEVGLTAVPTQVRRASFVRAMIYGG